MSRVMVVLLAAVLAVGLMGCGDNGANTGGGGVGGGNTCGKDGTAGSCKTVVIDGQTWMAENLNYQTGNSWCYKDSSSYCNKYGRLYTWEAAVSACQSIGWRLPDTADWNKLESVAGGSSVAGKALKSTSGWVYNGNSTDSYGFSALPAGYRYTDGSFNTAGNFGFWWTATEIGSGFASYRKMGYYDGVDEYEYVVGFGLSVRCIAD